MEGILAQNATVVHGIDWRPVCMTTHSASCSAQFVVLATLHLLGAAGRAGLPLLQSVGAMEFE